MTTTRIAISAQSLFLANLLLLPGLSFFLLLFLFYTYKGTWGVGRIHLYRALQLSMLNGLMLLILPLIFVLGSANQSAALMLMLFYFVCMHSAFVLVGIFNLSRAMSNKNPLF